MTTFVTLPCQADRWETIDLQSQQHQPEPPRPLDALKNHVIKPAKISSALWRELRNYYIKAEELVSYFFHFPFQNAGC